MFFVIGPIGGILYSQADMSVSRFTPGADTYATSLRATGTGGGGFLELQTQSAAVSNAPTDGLRLYSDAAGALGIADDTVNRAIVSMASLTASRNYSLPDASGALVGASAVQTLSNKTILSTDGNTVDATRIGGAQVTGPPVTGQFLQYNGSTWTPAALAASSPATLVGNTIGVTVGSGGVASFNDPRFTNPRVLRVKTSSVGFGEFSSVAAALASITDNSPTNRYVISVGTGEFTESALVMKPYVSLQGVDQSATVLIPSAGNITLLRTAANSTVQSLTLRGINIVNTSSIGVLINSVVDSYVIGVNVTGFHTCIKVRASTGPCDAIVNGYLIDAPHNTPIEVAGGVTNSSFPINIAITSGRIRCYSGTNAGLLVEGQYSKVNMTEFRIVGASNGFGVLVATDADLQLSDGKITECGDGLYMPDYGGSGVKINTRNILFADNSISDISQADTVSTGVISGQADRNKVIVASDGIVISYLDIVQPAAINVGQFIYAPIHDAILTDTGPLITQTAAIGCYEGCVLSEAGGLDVGVSASKGYVVNTVSGLDYARGVEWAATTVTVPADSVTYIYVDDGGIVSQSGSVPIPTRSILIGRVISGASSVQIIDMQLQSNLHPDTNSFVTQRSIGGVVFASGAITSMGPLNAVNVTSGVRYYANNQIDSVGGTGLAFAGYWRNGVGGWTRTAGLTTVSAQYDNNSGTPVAVPVGKWARFLLYLAGEGSSEQYMLLYGQAVFNTELEAANDGTTIPPPYFNEGITAIAALITDDAGTITVRDMRTLPRTGSSGGVIAGTTNHGDLSGLTADDHLQYLLVNGARAMAGALNMGGNAVTNVGLVDGVDVSAHGSRHLPAGADPLTTAAPTGAVSGASTNAEGVANSFARSDHSHALDVSAVSLNSLTGVLDVSRGGTGAATLTSGGVLVGNGTGVVSTLKAAPAGDFVGTTDTQTLTNKSMTASSTRFTNAAGDGAVRFNVGAGAFTTILAFTFGGAGYTVTFPQGNGTVTYNNSNSVFNNKTIEGGVGGNTVHANLIRDVAISATAPTAGQVLIASDGTNAAWGGLSSLSGVLSVAQGGTGVSSLTSGRVLIGNGAGAVDLSKAAPAGSFVGTTDAQTLSAKVLTAASTQIRGATAGDNVTFTPSGNTAIVSGGAGTLTLPAGTQTLIGRDTTDVLTGKTIIDTSNTVAAKQLHTLTGVVAVGGAAAPTAGQVLTATSGTAANWQTPVVSTTFSDNTFAIVDNLDSSKQIRFDAAGTPITSTTIVSQQTADISVLLPAASTTLVGRDTVDTLTNKTLTAPIIATISNTGSLTLPTSTDTLVGRSTTDTLANKTLAAATTLIAGASGNVAFTATGGANTTTIAASAPGGNIVVSLPTVTATLVGRDTTDTLTNKTLSPSTVRFTDGSSRSFQFDSLGTSSTVATISSSLTASRTLTLPDISDTLVTKTSVDTFSNKTIVGGASGNELRADYVRNVLVGAVAPTAGQVLTATTISDASWVTPSVTTVTGVLPVANGGTGLSTLTLGRVLVGADASAVNLTKAAPVGDFVGTTDTQTLTGKTLSSTTNNVHARALINATGSVVIDGSAAPTTGQVMIASSGTAAAWSAPVFSDALFAVTDAIDATKRVVFDVNNLTGVTTTFTFAGTIARNIIVPDQNFTMAGTNNAQTFTNKTIGAGNNVTARALWASGTAVIVEGSAPPVAGQILTANGISSANWQNPVVTTTFDDATFAIYDTGATTKRLLFDVEGVVDTATTIACNQTANRTVTIPDASFTMVGEDIAQTLTNKTLSSTTNNVHARALINATGSVTVDGSAAPTTGQVLTASSGTVAAWATIPLKPSFMSGSQVVTKTSVEAATYVNVVSPDTTGAIIYRGDPSISITGMSFRAACSTPGAVFSARLQNITNGTTIIQFTGVITLTPQTLYSSNTVTNIPTITSALQLQTEFVSGSGSVTFTGWSIQLAS